MNPHAFEIIENLGLRHPNVYSLCDVVKANQNNFYLRYSRDLVDKSCVVSKEELILRKDKFEEDLSTGKLIEIEDFFQSVAGCVVYINADGIYGEYVSGHIVALLRRGLCRKRFFIDENNKVFIKDAFQGFEALQTSGGYNWSICTNRLDKLNEIIDYLINSMIARPKDLLMEILITENEIVVCDAKYPGMESAWQGMKKMFDLCDTTIFLKNIYNSDVIKRDIKVDGLDIDCSLPVKNLIVGNSAVLSHYITRNYGMYDMIKFI